MLYSILFLLLLISCYIYSGLTATPKLASHTQKFVYCFFSTDWKTLLQVSESKSIFKLLTMPFLFLFTEQPSPSSALVYTYIISCLWPCSALHCNVCSSPILMRSSISWGQELSLIHIPVTSSYIEFLHSWTFLNEQVYEQVYEGLNMFLTLREKQKF